MAHYSTLQIQILMIIKKHFQGSKVCTRAFIDKLVTSFITKIQHSSKLNISKTIALFFSYNLLYVNNDSIHLQGAKYWYGVFNLTYFW